MGYGDDSSPSGVKKRAYSPTPGDRSPKARKLHPGVREREIQANKERKSFKEQGISNQQLGELSRKQEREDRDTANRHKEATMRAKAEEYDRRHAAAAKKKETEEFLKSMRKKAKIAEESMEDGDAAKEERESLAQKAAVAAFREEARHAWQAHKAPGGESDRWKEAGHKSNPEPWSF